MYFTAIWNILQTLGIFYDHLVHLVHFVIIGCIFFRFWYHAPEKSDNPVA
jgi:hypothetical protein